MRIYLEKLYKDPQQHRDSGGIWDTQIAWAGILASLVTTRVALVKLLNQCFLSPSSRKGGIKIVCMSHVC